MGPALVSPAESLFARDGEGHLICLAPWPERVSLSDALIRQLAECSLHWPFLRIIALNGHAIYRVETLERGHWEGPLVESWYGGSH